MRAGALGVITEGEQGLREGTAHPPSLRGLQHSSV